MIDLFPFFSDYLQSQLDGIKDNVLNITSPAYMYFFLAILIRIYRKLKNWI